MATKPKNPIFGNWWKGRGDSKYDSSHFENLTNADFSSTLGLLQCNFDLKKESGNTITELCTNVVCPSGTIYFFSQTSGKIWKRNTSGVYSVVTANANGSGCYGAGYYNGWVFYTDHTTKLGRFKADTEASRNDSWKTFSTSGSPRPMMVQNLILHIGDGYKVFTVNVNDATTTALQLEDYHLISAFHNYGYDLAIMTYTGGYRNRSGLFIWDTASVSWSSEYYIAESCINFVITTDRTDTFFISAGTIGNIYMFDGTMISFWKQIKTAPIIANGYHYQRAVNFNRKGLFAQNDNIYSISIPSNGMNWALNHEYTCTAGTGGYISSICASGNTNIFISWQSAEGGHGIDTIDTNYATTTVTTPLVSKRIHDIRVYTDSLPTGTSIGIEVNEDNAGWVSKNVISDQTDELVVKIDGDIANKRTIQARITLNPYNTGTPATPSISHIEFV